MAFTRIEIHFVVNGRKRHAVIEPGSRVRAIRFGTGAGNTPGAKVVNQPPPKNDVRILADEAGDTVAGCLLRDRESDVLLVMRRHYRGSGLRGMLQESSRSRN
jgi:hypothetical protein